MSSPFEFAKPPSQRCTTQNLLCTTSYSSPARGPELTVRLKPCSLYVTRFPASKMPKARQTCTRCSLRRQKCDRKDPCTRCVQSSQADSCSRKWPYDYDPKIHRTYPKTSGLKLAPGKHSPESNVNSLLSRDPDRVEHQATTQRAILAPPTHQEQSTSAVNARNLTGRTYTNGSRRTTPVERGISRARNDPTSLEFLTNGIITPFDFDPNNIQSSANPDANPANLSNAANSSTADICPRVVQTHYLQTLIPSARQIQSLVDYHEQRLLWYHRTLHGPTFRKELQEASQPSTGLQLKHLDLRWCALLFSIMAASLTCTSESLAHSWGFSRSEKVALSKQWYKATVSCLSLGEYASKLHVHSVQAIQVMNLSAHTLGFLNEVFVYLGAALRISQSLGFQRLAYDTELDSLTVNGTETSQDREERLVKREVGRRIWIILCTQDWFSIPSTEMYSVRKQQFTTIKPNRFDDEMMLVGENVALGTDLGNYLHDIASLMADFHDSVTSAVGLAAKYEQVLTYDSRLRALGTESVPPSFTLRESNEPAKPRWQAWLRGAANIMYQHKIVMMHRNFLGKSFGDPRFAYTRWASITASKIILREVELASSDAERPVLWTDQV